MTHTIIPTSVDVIIPVYNGREYLLQALRSVDEQTLQPRQIIVVNDGSTDDSENVVLSFRSNSRCNIEYIKKQNGGVNSARNAGLRRATAEYVAFLDADDEWHPLKLEKQIDALRSSEYKDLGVIYCRYITIDALGEPFFVQNVFVSKMRGQVFDALLENNGISGSASAAIIKRACFEKVGYFDENLHVAEDWDMWLRLSEYYSFDYTNQELVRIRLHARNTQGKKTYFFINQLAFYEKWTAKLPHGHKVYPVWEKALIKLLIKNGRGSLRLLEKNLSEAARHKIFSRTNGSVIRSAIGLAPCLFAATAVRKLRLLFPDSWSQ